MCWAEMETTCVLIKPDAMRAHHIGEIIARFEKAGLEITNCRMLRLESTVLATHYAHLVGKGFYPELETFMQSSPVVALAVTGEGAVAKVRTLAGPTDPAKADAGTIRKDFGTDVMLNAVHASDAPEAAVAELKRFGLG
jgi:nucleoside-diphosphate kinase